MEKNERKRMEEALRESEEKLRVLVEAISDWIWEVDQNTIFTYISPKVKHLLGYAPEEIIGKTPFDLMPLEEAERVGKIFQKITEAQEPFARLEDINLHKDGHRVVFETSVMPIFDSNRGFMGFWGINRDITEQKQTEQKLKESEAKNRTLFETSAEGILVADIETMKFNYANPSICRMLGYSEEELKKLHVSDIHPKYVLEQVISEFEAQARGEKELAQNFPCLRKDGNIIWVEINNTKTVINGRECNVGFYRDIIARKKAEDQIKYAHSELNQIFNGLFPMCVIDKNYNNIRVNDRFNSFYNLKKDEAYGKKCHEIRKGHRCFTNECTMKQIIEGKEIVNYEIDKELIKGKEFSFIITALPYRNPDGETIGVIETFMDTTESKKAEQRLKESKEKYSNLINDISDIIFRIDLNGIIKYFSQQSYEILGYLPEELIDTNLLKKVHPDDLLKVANNIRETIESKREINADFKYQHKNGHYIHLSAKGRLVIKNGKEEITGIITDITKKKKMEIKLRESEKKYRGILENIAEGYFEIDLRGNLIFFNESYLNLLGYSREELLGLNYRKFMDEQGARHAFERLNYVYKTENSLNDLQLEVIRKDGEKRFHQTSVNLIHDSRGKIIGFQGIVRDITEKKKAEELEQKFKEQLEDEVQIRTKELKIALEQQKLYLDQILQSSHIKDEFLATMSHELRTPLNAIIGFTDLLLEGGYGPLNRDHLEFVKDIKSSAEHQFEMVKDILDISKIESGKISLHLQETSIKNIIEQIKSTVNPDYSKKDLKFEIKGLKNDKLIVADPIKLKEILIHLLDNAVKYTTKGKITFIFKEDKENWIFKVKDTGIGIDKKYFDIIFKEFKRVDSEYVSSLPGTGLGLSLTKRLVALHGGTISFTSKLGVGSTFIFTIPKSLSIPSGKKVESFLDIL